MKNSARKNLKVGNEEKDDLIKQETCKNTPDSTVNETYISGWRKYVFCASKLTDGVLQILLILAYLAIGLLSVTFPIYALCVTYLKQEKWVSEKERKKKLKIAKQEIVKMTNELSTESEGSKRFLELNKRIKECKKEQTKLEERPYYLTARGVVLLQTILLLGALSSACVGLLSFYDEYQLNVVAAIVLSAIFSSLAIVGLSRTILTVERAALRGAVEVEVIPQFKETGTLTQEVKVSKEVDITIGVYTPDKDLDMASYSVFFPPEIEVKQTSAQLSPQPERGVEFPNYAMVYFSESFSPKFLIQSAKCRIIAKQVGKFKILVRVKAREIEESTGELTLKVVN